MPFLLFRVSFYVSQYFFWYFHLVSRFLRFQSLSTRQTGQLGFRSWDPISTLQSDKLVLSIEETCTSGPPPARPHSHTFVAKWRLEPRDRGAALFLWQTGHQGVLTFLFTQEYHHQSNIGKEPGLHPVSLFNYKILTLLIRSQMLMRLQRVMPGFRCQI